MITQTDIVNVLQNLGVSRPAFCSEADFQLSFSWELKTYLAQSQSVLYEIFLERRFETNAKDCYVDICIESEDELYLIELKYKTIRDMVQMSNRLNGKHLLKEQAANDLGRYGYLKDVCRIENILGTRTDKIIRKGFAIILTNDSKYYKEPTFALNTIDHTFRIHERTTSLNPFVNSIRWSFNGKAPNWSKSYPSFTILHAPTFKWLKYSTQTNSTFKYLITEI